MKKVIIVIVLIAIITIGILSIKNNTTEKTENYSMYNIYEYAYNVEHIYIDIYNYTTSGTDASLQVMDEQDLEYRISKLNNYMNEFNNYNDYINSLQDSKYDNLKSIWSMLSKEFDRMNNIIQAEKPTANNQAYNFSLGSSTMYLEELEQETYLLNQ